MPLICDCSDLETADQVYCCTALRAWSRGRVSEARRGAEEALNIDPLHSLSWLLHAFALYREGERARAMSELETLATDPVVGRQARFALALHGRQHTRDQVAVSVGYLHTDTVGGTALLDIPIAGPWGVRVGGGWAGRGPARRLRGGGAVSLGWVAGAWRARVLVGVVGRRWLDSEHVAAAAEAITGVDVRLGAGIGLGVELGLGMDVDPRTPLPYTLNRAVVTYHAPSRRLRRQSVQR